MFPVPRHHPGVILEDLWHARRKGSEASREKFEDDLTRCTGLRTRVIPSLRWGVAWLAAEKKWSRGDTLLLPEYVFPGLVFLLERMGFRLEFLPVCENTLFVNHDLLPLRTNARAIILHHPLGLIGDMAPIRKWASDRGILTVEDRAHAFFPFPVDPPLDENSYLLYSFSVGKHLPCGGGGIAGRGRLPSMNDFTSTPVGVSKDIIIAAMAAVLFLPKLHAVTIWPLVRFLQTVRPSILESLFLDKSEKTTVVSRWSANAAMLGLRLLPRLGERHQRRSDIAFQIRRRLPPPMTQSGFSEKNHSWGGVLLRETPASGFADRMRDAGIDLRPDANRWFGAARASTRTGHWLIPCYPELSDTEINHIGDALEDLAAAFLDQTTGRPA